MKLSTPGGIRTWLAIAQFLMGIAACGLGAVQRSVLVFFLGLSAVLLGIGLWRLSEWARRLTVITWLGLLVYGTLIAASWNALPMLVALVPIAWAYWHFFSPVQVALQKAANSLEVADGERPR